MSIVMNKVGRNDPCPCGSGKKFKQCHGAPGVAAPVEPKTDPMQLIQAGVALQQAGSLDAAEHWYRRVLDADPKHVDALHLLGLLLHQRGEHMQGAALMEQAIRLNPNMAAFHNNCGEAYRAGGEFGRSIQCYDEAIRLQPDFAEAQVNRGVVLRGLHRFDEAIAAYRRAIELRPDFRTAYVNLANVLGEIERVDEAIAALRAALKIDEDDPVTLNDLGVLLMGLGQTDEAQTILNRALALDPGNAEIVNNRGALFNQLSMQHEAVDYARRAIALNPAYADAHKNLGAALSRLGDHKGAIAAYESGLAVAPDYAEMHVFLAQGLFAVGDLRRGWEEYAWRFRKKIGAPMPRKFPAPPWQGDPLSGKTLLVWGEQGIGDELWAAGMYADLLDRLGRGGRLIIECAPKLVLLLQLSFPAAVVVARSDPPDSRTRHSDFQIACGNIGKYLRPEISSFPHRVGYLSADPLREKYWRDTLQKFGPQLKVGICWRSSDINGPRAAFSTQLHDWHRVLATANVVFVKLQYDECSAELGAAEAACGVKIEHFPQVDMRDDLAETAALMRGLDLVICAPTAVGVMSAALGVPTWQMNFGADWQYHGTQHSLWYPGLRTFFRNWDEDWPTVLGRIASELGKLAAANDSGADESLQP